jgi:biopolymer transport protein ExbD
MVENSDPKTKPAINVTPLIDVLLVMLIIFMVSAPLRPHRFMTKLPAEPDNHPVLPDPRTLVVTVQSDHTLKLNGLADDMGTIEDSERLRKALTSLFQERTRNHVYSDEMRSRFDVPEDDRILKTVFIKAPRAFTYGEVVQVIDSVKGAGARPVGLQLDSLN